MNRTNLDAAIVAALLLAHVPGLAGAFHPISAGCAPAASISLLLTAPDLTPDNPAERL